MNEVEIHVGSLQLLKVFGERPEGSFIALIRIPNFCGKEYFLSWDSTIKHGIAYALFIAVNRGSIDEPVAMTTEF
ncbi:MAG TPA: hypothetical protein DCP28_11560 [Cytophagales bacterium]|nr:hypothetical protein [Cytophagales bacterium]